MPELQVLTEFEFARKLGEFWPAELPAGTLQKLFVHYEELRRWAGTIALIGPGAVGELFERHYAESLMALAWLPRGIAQPGKPGRPSTQRSGRC